MPESTLTHSSSPSSSNTMEVMKVHKKSSTWPFLGSTFLLTVISPVLLATILYRLDSFDPAPIPVHELTQELMFVPRQNLNSLQGSERIGFGELLGPEDIVFDSKAGVLFTGGSDGWINRVRIMNDSVTVVEKWVNTGGRPLGLSCGYSNNELIVADAHKGLLKISAEGEITLLTDEAEGLKFGLTDAVVAAKNGMIYFSDASHKYTLHNYAMDFFEGRPNGRILSYDPSTKRTRVIARDLYFANGVALSPDEDFVIFCESPMRRCKKYYIRGEREGLIDMFVDNLPGVPDNIRYDGEGHYWIALTSENAYAWQVAQKYPFIRKVFAMMDKYIGRPHLEKNGGVIAIDVEGKPTDLYIDQKLSLVSSVIKIGEFLYLGSIENPYIVRLNPTKYPAVQVLDHS